MMMSYTAIGITFLLLNIIHGLAMLPFYKAAGYNAKHAFIPFYNLWIWMKINNRPTYWAIGFIFPVVNNVMVIVSWIDTHRKFFTRNSRNEWLIILTLGLYFFVLGRQTLDYQKDRTQPKKKHDEWVRSIIFALIVATLVRSYTAEAYTIPTSSMEKTLMVGDYLFVSKWTYGFRSPMTPVSLPFFHDKIMGTDIDAYSDVLQFPYERWAKSEPKRKDIIVFSYPENKAPLDKKQLYVKRCVAQPNDVLEIKEGRIYVGGELIESGFGKRQKLYALYTKNRLNEQRLIDQWDITEAIHYNRGLRAYSIFLQDEVAKTFKEQPFVDSLVRINPAFTGQNSYAFTYPKPYSIEQRWTKDFYGPLWIPKAGETRQIDSVFYHTYAHVINQFDDNTLASTPEGFTVNGKLADTYTFTHNYYFGVGDNRDNSLDSRFWGFVPENHLVGRPVFIWLSLDSKKSNFFDKIRWNRVMCYVTSEGELVDMKIISFLIIGLLIFLDRRYRKKKKAKELNSKTV